MTTTEELQDQAIATVEQAMRLVLNLGVPRTQIMTLTKNVTEQEEVAR
jgi:hypothetical protein